MASLDKLVLKQLKRALILLLLVQNCLYAHVLVSGTGTTAGGSAAGPGRVQGHVQAGSCTGISRPGIMSQAGYNEPGRVVNGPDYVITRIGSG